MSSTVPTSSALRALALEYKSLQEEPVEGFRVKLLGEDNLFEWEVAIFGPPDTLYQGGYFKVKVQDFVYTYFSWEDIAKHFIEVVIKNLQIVRKYRNLLNSLICYDKVESVNNTASFKDVITSKV